MKKNSWRILPLFILLTAVLSLSGCGMKDLPEGELIRSVDSPDKTYTVHAYLVNGGATVDFAVRCEVVDHSTEESHNIYWNYHQQDVDITWIDNETVTISGIRLNVQTDTYDYRDGEIKSSEKPVESSATKSDFSPADKAAFLADILSERIPTSFHAGIPFTGGQIS